MNYKKEIENLLKELAAMGISRGRIEEDLNYSPNYIDQALARGGNERFLRTLSSYRKQAANSQNVAKDNTDVFQMPHHGNSGVEMIATPKENPEHFYLIEVKRLSDQYISELKE